MKNVVMATVALVVLAVVAGGGYAVGRSSERSNQDDVIRDCKDVIAAFKMALEAPDDGANRTYGISQDNRCDVAR